jgi:putative acetyltransferase
MITFRTEEPEDLAAIREVHLEAFDPSRNEAALVDLLREAGKAPISLVALLDGQLAGHVLFSPVTIDPAPPGTLRGLGLAPIGVLPAFQRQGVGTQLIEQGLLDCERGGYDFVVVLATRCFTRALASRGQRITSWRTNTAWMNRSGCWSCGPALCGT